MFNNIFCKMKGKKVIYWGELGGMGNCPNYVLEVLFQYLLGYPSILLRYPSNDHIFMPSIGSLCVGSFYIFNFLCYNCSPEQ